MQSMYKNKNTRIPFTKNHRNYGNFFQLFVCLIMHEIDQESCFIWSSVWTTTKKTATQIQVFWKRLNY